MLENSIIHSDYYLVIYNPYKHIKILNAIKTLMVIAEANYIVYEDEELDYIELHPLSKDEYKYYNYNPN